MTSRVRIFLPRTRHRETLPSATSLFVCSNHSSVTPAAAMSNPAWEHRAKIVRHHHSCGEQDAKPVMWQSTSSPVCAVDSPQSPSSVSHWNAAPPSCCPLPAISETFAHAGWATTTSKLPLLLSLEAGTIPPDSHTLGFLASARIRTTPARDMLKLRNSAACSPVTPQCTTRKERKIHSTASFGHCFCRHRGANRLYNLSR